MSSAVHAAVVVAVITVVIAVGIAITATSVSPERFLSAPKKPTIWMFWETAPGKTKPAYIDLCMDTVRHNCAREFDVVVLDERRIRRYLPELRRDLGPLTIPVRTDYYRYCLLERYGGIWLDADIIVVRSLRPMLERLREHNFVGFGCHFGDRVCKARGNGYPYPTNWAMAARPRDALMTRCRVACERLFDAGVERLATPSQYFRIGRQLLRTEIAALLARGGRWSYYHYDSPCVERDSRGDKVRNHRMISNEAFDAPCAARYMLVPIYNTAPGFPEWFRRLSKRELLTADMLISKIFRLAMYPRLSTKTKKGPRKTTRAPAQN